MKLNTKMLNQMIQDHGKTLNQTIPKRILISKRILKFLKGTLMIIES
jgi:hypothetical protein